MILKAFFSFVFFTFQRVIFSIGGCFLYYMDHFKLYSSFCACHSRAQKILDPNRGNQALMEFLAARNPKQQHSASLASYLIKPIQVSPNQPDPHLILQCRCCLLLLFVSRCCNPKILLYLTISYFFFLTLSSNREY